MDLKWEKRSHDTIALTGMFEDGITTLGWVMPKYANRYVGHGQEKWLEVGIAGSLNLGTMPCEEQRFVTLRPAMRALKETVTVLLIGRGYGP